MFISSLWVVKEPTHYSKRVGDEVPAVVAVFRECLGGWVKQVHISCVAANTSTCSNKINNKQTNLSFSIFVLKPFVDTNSFCGYLASVRRERDAIITKEQRAKFYLEMMDVAVVDLKVPYREL